MIANSKKFKIGFKQIRNRTLLFGREKKILHDAGKLILFNSGKLEKKNFLKNIRAITKYEEQAHSF